MIGLYALLMNELITIFTPTYNRANLLPVLYKSLCKQEKKNFIWLVVDDGSTDNTCDLIEQWKHNSSFDIKYIYKENHGLSSGYNAAIELIETELSVCIDSDDELFAANTTAVIEEKYQQYNTNESFAGIVGMDAFPDGTIVTDRLREGGIINFLKYEVDKKKRGDVKIVVRSECYKKVAPVKLYKDERGISPHILHMKICENHFFVSIDSCLCTVNYQNDGMSKNDWKQYYDSPNSFADLREYCLQKELSGIIRKMFVAIHYDSSCILAHRRIFQINTPKKILTWTLVPIGFLFSRIVIIKGRK